MRVNWMWLLTAALCARAPVVAAQDADQPSPVESVLVTATRVATAIDDATGATVIDRATMLQRGYTTLADALTAVAGVQVVQSGGPGANASVFMRGADSNQVQVLVDGVPVNDPSGPGGAFNFGVDTLADVARIEVVRGPMSAVYGSGAIGGVINVITERGAGDGGSATLAAGVPAALLAEGHWHGRRGAVDYGVSVQSRSDRGFDATPQRETVYTGERDGFRSRTGAFEIGYTPVADTRLFADMRARSSVYGYDDVNYPAFDDPNDTARDNDLFGRAGVNSVLLGGAWRTGLVIAHDQQYRRYTNRLDAVDPNAAAEDSRYLGTRTDAQWNNVMALPDAGWVRGASLTLGTEYAAESAREKLNSIAGGYPYLASVNARDERESAYAGVVATVARHWVLTGDARAQRVGGVGDALTWRAGASYAIPMLASHVKASGGTAFLAPSLFDRYGVDNSGYVGNPALKPERSVGGELGWLVELPGLRLEATWFRTRVQDLIQTETAPVTTSENVDAARLQGVELSMAVQPARWIDARITYTYTDARNLATGALLLRRPYDSGSAIVTLRPWQALSIVPQVTMRGGDRDALIDNAGYFVADGRNRGGARIDLSINYRIVTRLEAFVWARNIADSHAEPASGYAAPGASFLAGMRTTY